MQARGARGASPAPRRIRAFLALPPPGWPFPCGAWQRISSWWVPVVTSDGRRATAVFVAVSTCETGFVPSSVTSSVTNSVTNSMTSSDRGRSVCACWCEAARGSPKFRRVVCDRSTTSRSAASMFGDPTLGDPKPDTRHDPTRLHEALSHSTLHGDHSIQRRGFVHARGSWLARCIASRRYASARAKPHVAHVHGEFDGVAVVRHLRCLAAARRGDRL